MKTDKKIILNDLLNWYEETNPSLGDLENELSYHNYNLTTAGFLKILKARKINKGKKSKQTELFSFIL